MVEAVPESFLVAAGLLVEEGASLVVSAVQSALKPQDLGQTLVFVVAFRVGSLLPVYPSQRGVRVVCQL